MSRENQLIAMQRFCNGENPSFSTGICGNLTAGFGELDEYGYWEFPLPGKAEDYLKLTIEPKPLIGD